MYNLEKKAKENQTAWCAKLRLIMREKLVSFADPALTFGKIKPCTKKEQRSRDIKLFKFEIISYDKPIGRVEMVEEQVKYGGDIIPIEERKQRFHLWMDGFNGYETEPDFVKNGSFRQSNFDDNKDMELIARKFAKFIRKAGYGKGA